jgi:cholesterol oxidase
MLGVVRYPYMPTDVDRNIRQVAIEMGRGETFNKAPVGVYFGSPGVEAEDPYFGEVGPRRTGCISCGNCNIGCGHNGAMAIGPIMRVSVHSPHLTTPPSGGEACHV